MESSSAPNLLSDLPDLATSPSRTSMVPARRVVNPASLYSSRAKRIPPSALPATPKRLKRLGDTPTPTRRQTSGWSRRFMLRSIEVLRGPYAFQRAML